jgi:hypothetical protein
LFQDAISKRGLINLWLFLFAAQLKEFFFDGLKKLGNEVTNMWSSGENM